MKYGSPAVQASTPGSSVGNQLQTFYFQKQALIEARKLQFFSQLADVTAMPKNMGKTIKRYQYIPLLDDQNVNDQGLDAAGAVIANGNLYGSSKDIGTIAGKLPMLTENGGRVNRVGFKRKELSGTFDKFGFFEEYTQETMDFDSDADLEQHITREMVNGAYEITEDKLQADLLNSAGVIRYPGAATSKATLTDATVVGYKDLMKLGIDLTNNRTPMQTTMITGTRLIDTKVLPGARVIYCGSELLPTLKAMKDLHNNPAFIPVEKYASGGDTVNGEVGAIDQFRIVIVPEMLKWAGAGGDASATSTHYETNNKYDVFPMLCIGDGSFTTIGFQTDGKSVKFKIFHKKPGEETADRNDPYGEMGFMSIKWYYGFMVLRPERIGLILTTATL
jgi:N4-gp56 family major capsid protein